MAHELFVLRNLLVPAGPTTTTDAFWRSSRVKPVLRTDYSKEFHTFGMEWSEDYLFTYLDTRLQQVLYWNFPQDQDMWQQGYFAGQTVNSSLLVDPWSQTGRSNTPFDQPFYLILNVAVGSTNGWFEDGVGNKPWTDQGHAASDFYKGMLFSRTCLSQLCLK
jgi:beta-glucanase (GH16 family)